jgi:hypothetical protein
VKFFTYGFYANTLDMVGSDFRELYWRRIGDSQTVSFHRVRIPEKSSGSDSFFWQATGINGMVLDKI